MIDEPNRSDNDLLKRQDARQKGWQDAFDRQIADSTRNELNIASHYRFSPERLRLFKDQTRQFVQYNTITGFEDAADVWKLQPASGENYHIESAESNTYIVGYTLQASFAFSVNQSLQSGDSIRVGPYNGTGGWFMEQRGGDHTDSQVDIIASRGGVETTLEQDAELTKPITDYTRFASEYNWYGVGNQIWKQTYTENGTQYNEVFSKTSIDGERGPETGNLNMWYEVTAGPSTSGLELNVGSCGSIVYGDTTSINRDKPQRVSVTLPATTNTWEPVYAIRINPNNPNVNANFTKLEILSYGNNTDVELVAVNFDASKTDASGWGVPGYHHAQNSALQSTENISQVANTSGTVKDLASGEKFGGYTLAAAQIVSGGNTVRTSATASTQTVEKKNILESDHLVVLARTSNGGGLLRFIWDADQEW